MHAAAASLLSTSCGSLSSAGDAIRLRHLARLSQAAQEPTEVLLHLRFGDIKGQRLSEMRKKDAFPSSALSTVLVRTPR
jgi:hypothetical protein